LTKIDPQTKKAQSRAQLHNLLARFTLSGLGLVDQALYLDSGLLSSFEEDVCLCFGLGWQLISWKPPEVCEVGVRC